MNKFEEEFLVVPDIEPVKNFLANALNTKISGDGVQYNMIIQQFKVRDDPDTLWKVLIGLSSYTSLFTQRQFIFKDLLDCIFKFDWKCEKKVSVAIINLIGHIVSANATYLSDAFHLFAKSLLPSMTTTLASETVDESLDDRRRYIHLAIRAILSQVPTGHSVLFPILAHTFPHKRFSRNVQTEYVSQLLVICEYFPLIQGKVLDLIVSKCLEMDVEIVIEDSGDVRIHEEYEGEEDDGAGGLIFDFEDDIAHREDKLNKTITPVKRGNAVESGPRIPLEVAEMADKLDSMLLLLVQFFDTELSRSEESRDRLMNQLSAAFEARILSTHKSKFVQYCVFYVAAKNIAFAQSFALKLLGIALDTRAASINRQSAVMYLASYLSRANFLSNEFVNDVLSQLITWASTYVTRTGASTVTRQTSNSMDGLLHDTAAALSGKVYGMRKSQSAPVLSLADVAAARTLSGSQYLHSQSQTQFAVENEVEMDEFGRIMQRESSVSRHEIFYSVVQSACYILCFYGTEMAAAQRMSPELKSHWETVVTCHYDPLRYCLKSVRIEFLKLCMHVGLFEEFCWEGFSPDLLYVDGGHLIYTSTSAAAAMATDNGTITTRGDSTYDGRNGGVMHSQSNAYYSRLGLGANPLDSFFPYDPCLLIKLHATIESGYRCWHGVPGMEADDETLESNDEDDEDDDDEDGVYSESYGESSNGQYSTASIAIEQRRGRGHSRHGSMSSATSMVSSVTHTEMYCGSMMSVAASQGGGGGAGAGTSLPGEMFMRALKGQHAELNTMAHTTAAQAQAQQQNAAYQASLAQAQAQAHGQMHTPSGAPSYEQWVDSAVIGDYAISGVGDDEDDQDLQHDNGAVLSQQALLHHEANGENIPAHMMPTVLGKGRRPRNFSIGSNGSW